MQARSCSILWAIFRNCENQRPSWKLHDNGTRSFCLQFLYGFIFLVSIEIYVTFWSHTVFFDFWIVYIVYFLFFTAFHYYDFELITLKKRQNQTKPAKCINSIGLIEVTEKWEREKKQCTTITLEHGTINWSQCCNDHGHGQMLKRQQQKHQIACDWRREKIHTSFLSIVSSVFSPFYSHFFVFVFMKYPLEHAELTSQFDTFRSNVQAYGRNLLLIMYLYTFNWANKCANSLFND